MDILSECDSATSPININIEPNMKNVKFKKVGNEVNSDLVEKLKTINQALNPKVQKKVYISDDDPFANIFCGKNENLD